MEELLNNKKMNDSLINFLKKYIIDSYTSEMIKYMIENNVKQHTIQFFFKKDFHIHNNRESIVINMCKLNYNYHNLYLFGCLKIENPELVFNIIKLLVNYTIDIKSILKNLSVKLKNKDTEKMRYISYYFELKLMNETDINFNTVTYILHNIVDILEKSKCIEEVNYLFNKKFFNSS